MGPQDAADIIRAISESIRQNPAQFQFNINATGLSVAAHGGGIGMVSSAVGGGQGSTTIGTNVGMEGASVEIVQAEANEAIAQRCQALTATLDTIARELKSATPNKSLIERAYRGMVGTWVPGVITSVIGSVLSKALG